MNDLIALTTGGFDTANSLAHSALPGSPVRDTQRGPAARATRRWTAARLNSVARATQHLANRVAA